MSGGRRRPASVSPSPEDVARVLRLAGAPERGPVPPALVLLVGTPGSGKSTFARLLAPRIPAAHIESDRARFTLVERPRYSRGESRRVFAAIYATLDTLLRDGRSVILDATHTLAQERSPAIELAERARARLVVVHVTAPESVVLERLGRRGTERDRLDRSEADERVYRVMAARFERITRPHLRIDTSGDLERAVQEVLRVIERGGQRV